MKTIRLTVKRADNYRGKQSSRFSCPVARAMNRKLNVTSKGQSRSDVNGRFVTTDEGVWRAEQRLVKAITEWDENKTPILGRFELSLMR